MEKVCESLDVARRSVDPEKLWNTYQNLGIHIVCFDDEAYPAQLREIHDAPVLLYVRGNLQTLKGKNIAFVGTRQISEYGRQVTHKLVSDLASAGVCVVSGLAQGVDGHAHRAALTHRLPTVAVLGSGIDVIYPSSHRELATQIIAEGGALVSEYPLGTPPDKFRFPQRNRIVAGLSYGVIIIEGNLKSGSLITARLALEENRSVYAVPGNIFSPGSEGPLSLLKHGAVPVTNGRDILEDLNWLHASAPENLAQLSLNLGASESATPVADAADDLSSEERKVLSLIAYDPTSLESIQQRAEMDASNLGVILTLLELNGWVVALPGAKFCRK